MKDEDTLRLLLEVADFGWFLTAETQRARATRVPGNVPILVLCSLALDGSQRPTDLAAATRLTSGRMTQVIDDLERDGLVRRTPDPTDGRAILVEITPDGSDEVSSLGSALVEVMRVHADRLVAFRNTLDALAPVDPG